MRVLFAVHGWPPELAGGTELSTRALAHALARAGHEIVVFAGSMTAPAGRASAAPEVDVLRGSDPAQPPVRVVRARRADLYFDHWHKSRSPAVRRMFEELLDEVRPDVVHVHHWIRLSDDLVAAASGRGVPSVVTLHDLWTSCLLAFRVRPGTRAACDETAGPDPCVDCAAELPPRTPWIDAAEGSARFGRRSRALREELSLAAAVVVPTRAHARALERFVPGLQLGAAHVIAPTTPFAEQSDRTEIGPAHGEAGTALNVTTWGALAEHKGIDLWVDAARAAQGRAEIVWRAAGAFASSDLRAATLERAAGLSMHFDPPFDLAQLRQQRVAAADVWVSTTRAHESYGLALDEARLLGLPCVLPRIPAFEERRPPDSGVAWYRPGDSASLAEVVVELAGDPQRLARLREQVRRSPMPPQPQESAERHEELYRVALRRGVSDEARAGVCADADDGGERASAEIERWDAQLSSHSAEQLGFAAGPADAGRARD